jgi:hypothetical protein
MARMRILLPAVLAAAGLAAMPGAAVAQEPGVVVDPGSPAGKEYAIPVARARREAGVDRATSGSSGSSTQAKPELFGAGISPRKAAPTKPEKTGSKSSESDSGGAPAGGGGGSSSGGSGGPGAAAAAAVQSRPSANALPWLAGPAAAVLLIGAAAGLLMRRRSMLDRGTPRAGPA